MSAQFRTFRPTRLAVVLATLASGLALSAPAASASDTFSLDNQSSVVTLTGTSLWGKGNTMNAGCRTGPFPGPTLESFTFNPGDQGSITLDQSPFTKCLSGINPLKDNPITSPYLTGGTWTWIPVDPLIGYATLTCYSDRGYGTQAVETEVDGHTCTVYDGQPSSTGSFTSSAAPVRGGAAVAYLQHFPGTLAGAPQGTSSQARYKLILRNPKGGNHGRVKTTIVSGNSRKVRVPISKALRMKVAKKGYVRVKAILKRVDGQPGSGDRATLVVMKDHKSLPF